MPAKANVSLVQAPTSPLDADADREHLHTPAHRGRTRGCGEDRRSNQRQEGARGTEGTRRRSIARTRAVDTASEDNIELPKSQEQRRLEFNPVTMVATLDRVRVHSNVQLASHGSV